MEGDPGPSMTEVEDEEEFVTPPGSPTCLASPLEPATDEVTTGDPKEETTGSIEGTGDEVASEPMAAAKAKKDLLHEMWTERLNDQEIEVCLSKHLSQVASE